MARKPQYDGPWRKVRRQVLERDEHTCQIAGPGCSGTATEVDHIRPVAMGGSWYDEANLRASCRRCNQRRNMKRLITPSRNW